MPDSVPSPCPANTAARVEGITSCARHIEPPGRLRWSGHACKASVQRRGPGSCRARVRTSSVPAALVKHLTQLWVCGLRRRPELGPTQQAQLAGVLPASLAAQGPCSHPISLSDLLVGCFCGVLRAESQIAKIICSGLAQPSAPACHWPYTAISCRTLIQGRKCSVHGINDTPMPPGMPPPVQQQR